MDNSAPQAEVAQARMPAEWEPQAATWLAWPHNQETWPHNLRDAQQEFCRVAQTLAESQLVRVIAPPELLPDARQLAGSPSQVEWFPIPTNDAWIRDYGPTFVVDPNRQELIGVRWQYNAWGGKYPPFDLDQQVASRICEALGIPLRESRLCFEGGALEVNASGLLLTTTSCALDPHRNRDWDRAGVTAELRRQLGVQHVVWLPGDALAGDDTDGHIDQLARFVNNREIVYAWTGNRNDPQFQGLSANLEQLGKMLVAADRECELTPLPIPSPITLHGRRLPASYCNFLIANAVVLVPQFGDRADAEALELLRGRFPGREVIGLPSRHLSVGLGSFHCLSQQQPALPR